MVIAGAFETARDATAPTAVDLVRALKDRKELRVHQNEIDGFLKQCG